MSVLTDLNNIIREKERELAELKRALLVLSTIDLGSTPEAHSEPVPAPLQATATEKTVAPAPSTGEQETPRPIPPPYTGPRCGACGAKMYQTYRTMPSGAVVNLLKCNDSACGNEAYQ